MYRSSYFFGLALCLLAFIPESSAALVSRDWLSQGDELLTFDSATNLEWLDLTQTIVHLPGSANSDRMPELAVAAETLEDGYAKVVALTAPGKRFAGFRPASIHDASTLFRSIGLRNEFFGNYPPEILISARRFFSLLGGVEGAEVTHTSATGMLSDVRLSPDERWFPLPERAFMQVYLAASSRDEFSLIRSTYSVYVQVPSLASSFRYPVSVVLVREVPETGCVALALIAATAVQRTPRRRALL
jgi:hypothetical protein